MPTILNLGCIVEGHGDVPSVCILLKRIREQVAPELQLTIHPPWRVGRNKLLKAGELERTIESLARLLPKPRAIFMLIDADDDCPRNLGPELLGRARKSRPDIPMGLVLAKREYEAWFLAAIESLGGERGFPKNPTEVSRPESIRDAKGRLSRQMEPGYNYSETVDQPALTSLFDMDLARRRSDSFDKCWREVASLLSTDSA